MQIRTASLTDAPLLAELGARTFKGAFADQNSMQNMDAYLEDAFSVDQMKKELQDSDAQFLVAEDAGYSIGYLKLRAFRTYDCIPDPKPMELERIYVDQNWIGKGVGAALMKKAIAITKEMGYKTLWLGVWQENESSIRFYNKWGFEAVGVKEFVVGEDVQYDHIMLRAIQ